MFIPSWSENLINISSCVVVVPIVVSVAKWIKCLVVGDIKVNLLAVGLLFVSNPLVVVEALLSKGDAAPPFQVKVLPFATVAIKTCPKLSNDHRPGSSETSDAVAASPQLPSPQPAIPQP